MERTDIGRQAALSATLLLCQDLVCSYPVCGPLFWTRQIIMLLKSINLTPVKFSSGFLEGFERKGGGSSITQQNSQSLFQHFSPSFPAVVHGVEDFFLPTSSSSVSSHGHVHLLLYLLLSFLSLCPPLGHFQSVPLEDPEMPSTHHAILWKTPWLPIHLPSMWLFLHPFMITQAAWQGPGQKTHHWLTRAGPDAPTSTLPRPSVLAPLMTLAQNCSLPMQNPGVKI